MHPNDFIKVSAGHSHGLALRRDGAVFGIGGVIEEGKIHTNVSVPPSLGPVIDIAAVNTTSWAITEDGKVTLWGLSGDSTMKANARAMAENLENAERIYFAVAGKNVVAIRHKGNSWTVFVIKNSNELVPCPKAAAALEGCVAVSLNDRIIVGILPKGVEPAQHQQLPEPNAENDNDSFPLKAVAEPGKLRLVPLPSELEEPPDAAFLEGIDGAVFAQLKGGDGYRLVAVREDGSLWNLRPGSVATPLGSSVHQVASHWQHEVILKQDGNLVDIEGNAIGDPERRYREFAEHTMGLFALDDAGTVQFIRIRSPKSENWETHRMQEIPEFEAPVTRLKLGNGHALALLENGNLSSWGGDSGGVVSNQPQIGDVRDFAGASNSSFAIIGEGRVFGWGAGLNPSTKNPVAKQFHRRLAEIDDAEQLFGGSEKICAIRHSGNRWSILTYPTTREGEFGGWRFDDEIAAQLEGCHFVTMNKSAIVGIYQE